jgi:HK97 gp10 family phage protein
MDFTFGFDTSELDKALDRLPEAVREPKVRKALRLGAQVIQQEMAERVAGRGDRFETPIVINDISRGERGADMEGDAVVAIGPSKSFFYGFEFGTSRQPARPFARPAFDAKHRESLARVSEYLWAEIHKAATKGGAK